MRSKQGKFGVGVGQKRGHRMEDIVTPVTMKGREGMYERQQGYHGEGLREEVRKRLDVEDQLRRLTGVPARPIAEPLDLRDLLAAHLILEEEKKQLIFHSRASRASSGSPAHASPRYSPARCPNRYMNLLPTPIPSLHHHNAPAHLSQSLLRMHDPLLQDSRLRAELLNQDLQLQIRAASAGKQLQKSRAKAIAKSAQDAVTFLKGQIALLTTRLLERGTELEAVKRNCDILQQQKQALTEELAKQQAESKRKAEQEHNALSNQFGEKNRINKDLLEKCEKSKSQLEGRVEELEAKLKALAHQKQLSQQKTQHHEQQIAQLKEKLSKQQAQHTNKIQQLLQQRNRTSNQSQLTNKLGKSSVQAQSLTKHYQVIIADLKQTHKRQIAVFHMEIDRLRGVLNDRDQEFAAIVKMVDSEKKRQPKSPTKQKTTEGTLFEILMERYRTSSM